MDSGKVSSSFSTRLENEMKKSIGLKAQNIRFYPIENYFFSENLSDYNGKTVILQFGRTTCSGCKMQMPELNKIQEKYSSKNVQVLFLFSDSKVVLKNYFENKKSSGKISVLEEKKLERPFQDVAQPTTFIIDKDGVIRDCWVTPEKFDSIEKRLQLYFVSFKL